MGTSDIAQVAFVDAVGGYLSLVVIVGILLSRKARACVVSQESRAICVSVSDYKASLCAKKAVANHVRAPSFT